MGSAQRGLLPCDAMVIKAVLSLVIAVVMLASPGVDLGTVASGQVH
jgi:hypothetical protein